MSPQCAIWTFERSRSSSKISTWRGPVLLAGREWAMIGAPVMTLARAAAVDLLDVLVHAGSSMHTDERLDVGPLDSRSMSAMKNSAI